MAEKKTQQKVIILLTAVLLAVIAASAVIIYMVQDESALQPTGEATEPVATEPVATEPVATEPVATQPKSNIFDASVLQRSGYTLLDVRLFIRGLLPVKPPVGVGKANPFL